MQKKTHRSDNKKTHPNLDVQVDEDIPSNDTTMPTTQQGPMTRARVQELNYQVNSFLAVHKASSQNWMLLNHCDDFIVIRNDGEEANGSTNQFGHQDCTTRKHKIGHQVQTSSSYSRATLNLFRNISRLRMLFEAYEYSLERY